MYILFFAVPTEIHLHFATYRVTFRSNRSQRTVHAGQNLTVLYNIYIVDTAFTGYIHIDATAVSANYISHKGVIQPEIDQNLITCCGAYVAGTECVPDCITG